MNVLIVTLSFISANPIALDNGAIRIEVDPELFSIRFVGFPGGENFVDPLFVAPSVRTGRGWADPGGLVTDVVPIHGHDAAVRRGPGEVVEKSPDSIVMVGPISQEKGIRLKKEIRLDRRRAVAHFTVSVSVLGPKPISCAVRNTSRVPSGDTLRLDKSDGTIRVLAGATSIFPAVVNSNRYWLIPVPPAHQLRDMVMGMMAPKVVLQNKDGAWTRRIVRPPAEPKSVPSEASFLCLLDDDTKSYGAALQGASARIDPCCPLVFEEEWTLEKRGK